jgi:quinol---cytochrome c reductase iron-sulfur subunit
VKALGRLLGRLMAWLAIGRAVRRRSEPVPGVVVHDPRERELPESERAEIVTAALLLISFGFALAFLVLYIVYPNTPLLGATAGLGLVAMAVALMVASLRVVPQVVEVEERDVLLREEQDAEVAQDIRAGVEGVSRRKLLMGAGGACACGLGIMLVAPAASLGPRVRKTLAASAWEKGRGVVDFEDRPVTADMFEVGSFLTGFPEGADKRDLGSPVVIVRVDPSQLRLGAQRRNWAPQGIVAYSQICTHAGCAVSEYRTPLYGPTAPGGPALVCPCHYSTFDPTRGAAVLFGPAGRPLPQLPLSIDAGGRLRAGGGLSDAPGPAWWGVKGHS